MEIISIKYEKLKIAPCRNYGSVMSNDMVIAGHNYTRHFGTLNNLKIGDAVIFTDMNGVRYPYQVEEVLTLEPTAVEEMQNSGWNLTLYTCTLSGQLRLTVRCSRNSK